MMLHDQLADSPLALPSSIYAPSQTGKPPNYHTHLTQWFGAKPATRIFQNSNRTYKGNINRKKLLLLWSLNQLLLYSGQCWCFMPITLFNHHNSLWIKTICRKEQVPGLPGRWCVCVSVTHLCLTLCLPMDCQPSGPSVHGILQAKILEWGAIAFSRRSSQPRDQTSVSCTAERFFTIWVNREVERP